MKKLDTASENTERIIRHFPPTGFVRLASILAPQGPIPVGRSTWWAGVKLWSVSRRR